MLQRDEDDKIIKISNFDRDMSIVLKDGTKVPVKGHVTETLHESGKIDVKVSLDRPLELQSDNPQPGLPQK